MKRTSRVAQRLLAGAACLAAGVALIALPAVAQTAASGALEVPAKIVPVPDTVGMSHAHYIRDDTTPETKEVFEEIAGFVDKNLGK
jgi:hypothetical protein